MRRGGYALRGCCDGMTRRFGFRTSKRAACSAANLTKSNKGGSTKRLERKYTHMLANRTVHVLSKRTIQSYYNTFTVNTYYGGKKKQRAGWWCERACVRNEAGAANSVLQIGTFALTTASRRLVRDSRKGGKRPEKPQGSDACVAQGQKQTGNQAQGSEWSAGQSGLDNGFDLRCMGPSWFTVFILLNSQVTDQSYCVVNGFRLRLTTK
ncbi:hypothetical protein V8E53_007733 [Lactarius tabidus]